MYGLSFTQVFSAHILARFPFPWAIFHAMIKTTFSAFCRENSHTLILSKRVFGAQCFFKMFMVAPKSWNFNMRKIALTKHGISGHSFTYQWVNQSCVGGGDKMSESLCSMQAVSRRPVQCAVCVLEEGCCGLGGCQLPPTPPKYQTRVGNGGAQGELLS